MNLSIIDSTGQVLSSVEPARAYAGIGSRETPEEVLDLMRRLGEALGRQGWLLRSGAAPGADSAFESGADLAGGQKEIYLPWSGFQNRRLGGGVQVLQQDILPAAEAIASEAHPRWPYLKRAVRALHSRNACQVLGPRLDAPVRFIVCWTKGGSGAGGTGQALRIAHKFGIPVFDLGSPGVLVRIQAWLDSPSRPPLEPPSPSPEAP